MDSTGTPETEKYLVLAQELIRNIYADMSPEDLHAWLVGQLGKVAASGSESAALEWLESFPFYDNVLAEREAKAALPASERLELTWPWTTWNNMIDPFEPGLLAIIAAGDGMGKCLGKGTKVVMYDGTLKKVEDVKVGDVLMGPDSKQRKVLSLGRGREPMFWIRQNSGIDYRCNASHLLSLLVRDKKGNKKHEIIEAGKVFNMPEWYIKRHLQGYKVAIEFQEEPVPIDPYFLGLWLGDGNKRNASIYASDDVVIDWLKEYAGKIKNNIKVIPDNEKETVFKVTISNGRGGNRHSLNTPGKVLSHMGLINNKHIPHFYINNSSDVRLKLLAGFIDSDGYYSPETKCYEIVQKRKMLLEQAKFIADTLGFATKFTSKRATIKARGVDTEVWRLRISGDIEKIPVLIKRKKAEIRTINKDWRVTGFTIELDKHDDYYGFTIDGDHQFLLEDMTVTHNTIYAEMIAEHWAKQGHKVAFVHFELNRAIMLDRRASRNASIKRRDLKKGPFSPELHNKWNNARNLLENYPGDITYWHTPGYSMEHVTRMLEPEIANGKCDVVVIDYLEKAQPSQRQTKLFKSDKYSREADDVEWIKTFAERTETPCMMLAQMNKAGKQKSFKDMDRGDIRGSGEKTEKGNIVVLLNRDKDTTGEQGGYVPFVDVLVDKNTLGPTGTFQQFMEGQYFRVGDVA